ncbi:hypothetical protein PCANC_02190 [Puccinia coronata f. sp. avenae]|uniref:Uncharacterized protein n=1 Tax=Puccinia coronata f. sp. avenae TaxID=200324 RepID=A0A2N5W0R2_9BASI|nr:hypothetical protein PCANC_02190 [Puccinia coronata f. sp. avenae]
MDNSQQKGPTWDELVAAAALLEQQKKQAPSDYQEARQNLGEGKGNDLSRGATPRGITTGGATPANNAQGGSAAPIPLEEILAAMGDTPGERGKKIPT